MLYELLSFYFERKYKSNIDLNIRFAKSFYSKCLGIDEKIVDRIKFVPFREKVSQGNFILETDLKNSIIKYNPYIFGLKFNKCMSLKNIEIIQMRILNALNFERIKEFFEKSPNKNFLILENDYETQKFSKEVFKFNTSFKEVLKEFYILGQDKIHPDIEKYVTIEERIQNITNME